MKYYLAFFFSLIFHQISVAQHFSRPIYPQNYFSWPVGNAAIGIVANFGELRPNHYHMGLDCRTDKVVNKPVYAAAEGYIAKIKIEPYGFGRAIYINHPNGFTTLYAHLNDFYPELEQYITQQQYKLQRWDIFIDIPQHLFPVKKGQLIAYSGNTGGSQGPHLHWEIRDTRTDKVINPLLFGLPIQDNVPPAILRLAVYDRTQGVYDQVPRFYPLKKSGSNYVTAAPKLMVYSQLSSFAITAYDVYTGSTNQNGIFQAVIFVDDKPVSGFQLNNISYDETRLLNANIDYKLKVNGGPYVQHLSRLPGNSADHYQSDASRGVVDLQPGQSKQIRIEVTDANNNTAVLSFMVERSTTEVAAAALPGPLFKPNEVNIFENEEVKFYLPENALYDAFHFRYGKFVPTIGKPVYQLHNHSVPLQTYFTVKIKDGLLYVPSNKMVMKRFFNNKEDFKKAELITEGADKGWYKAEFREFGNFQLVIDNEPPVVTALGGFKDGMNASKAKKIAFLIKDNSEDIKNFTALLDGKWLRFTNDKAKVFVYNFDENCAAGEHELKLTVEDMVGNITEKTYRFTR